MMSTAMFQQILHILLYFEEPLFTMLHRNFQMFFAAIAFDVAHHLISLFADTLGIPQFNKTFKDFVNCTKGYYYSLYSAFEAKIYECRFDTMVLFKFLLIDVYDIQVIGVSYINYSDLIIMLSNNVWL